MVADLEHIRMEVGILGEQTVFHGLFHVPGEKERAGAELDAEGERVVIAGFGGGEAGRRRQDSQASAGEVERGLGALRDDLDVKLAGAHEEGRQGVGADPEFARVEVFEDGGKSSRMIGMGVGGDDDIEAADTYGSRDRGKTTSSPVSRTGVALGCAILQQPTAVDEHRCAVGE